MKKLKITNKEFKNKRVFFDYEIIEKYEAGIVLQGTEVKSLRDGKISLNGSFCNFNDGELFVRGIDISTYNEGSYNNHFPKRDRKLLLHKKELKKLKVKIEEKGLTIVPIRLYTNEFNIFKLEIGLAVVKKNFDKKNTIYEKQERIRLKREFNINI